MNSVLGGQRLFDSQFHVSNSPTLVRRARAVVVAKRPSGGRSYDGDNARRSQKGDSYSNKKRRRGRPAWLRSPDDTPLRDGNRDRLMGLLTDRYAFLPSANPSTRILFRRRF